MQKRIFPMIFLVLFCIPAICGAMSPSKFLGELSLGGIWLDMPYKDVISMYGEPTRIEKGKGQLVRYTLFYGDSVEINIGKADGGKVIGVKSKANNGWSTPSGLHVGMPLPANLAEDIFGQPTLIERENQNRPWVNYVYIHRETIPAGYGANGMPSELSISRGITIGYADKLGKIKELHIWKEEYDPVPVRR